MNSKKIILGISGGIAAYKTPELVRRLRDRGAEVQVVMTHSANEFVTQTTLQAVSAYPVRQNLWDKEAEAAMGHIELARWADQVLIAPATAEIMSRLAVGAASDLLTTLCLATRAPVAIAPAMNNVMWQSPAVQENLRILTDRGVQILGPDSGDQACGETGPGRMMEPDAIASAITAPALVVDAPLAGKTVMITAGPTRESLDPVRFISNRSSGKMGYALAVAARDAGANVILVSGPVNLSAPDRVERIDVESAEQMHAATHQRIQDVDVFIGAAAVADYHPADTKSNKIKKSADEISISLVKSKDVLASVAALTDAPFTVGFAAETENLSDYARGKLEDKNLDMIVANKVGEKLGFDVDDNAVVVFWRDGEQAFPKASKIDIAHSLVKLIADKFREATDAGHPTKLTAVAASD